MLSAQDISTEVQPAADNALLYTPYAEGRLGTTNFIHYSHSQPSRSTKKFKRAENNNESEGLVRFRQTTTVIDDYVILIGGQESTEILPSNLLVLNSTLNVNEQNVKLPVSGHGAAPIRGSKVLITFGIQAIAPQRTFATPIQEIDIDTSVISFPQFNGKVPPQRYEHTTTKIDNKIYIYGGKNKDDMVLGDIFYIDLNLNSWNLIEQPSRPIAGHSSILIDNYLISCFGIDSNSKVVNDCNIFDISTNTYTQTIMNNEPPRPRTLSSMVSFEDNKSTVYIFGGIDEGDNGLNDLYKLDASKTPTLSWSPIIINAKINDKLIPSGRGAHSAFTIRNTGIMTIWGGMSKKDQIVDSNFYFFDIKGNTWVDENYYIEKIKPINVDGTRRTHIKVIIIGIIGAVVLILGLVSLFIIRKRRVFQRFQKKDINKNDPYNRPGQFGSNDYLIDDFESKQVQFKIIDESESESVPEPIPQPNSTLPSLQTKVEKEPEIQNDCQPNDSITSTTLPKKAPFGKLPALTNTGSTSESQRMKRTHKRTSSVSLTSSELANIARSRNFTHHKSSLSTNSITSSVNRSPLSNSSRNSLSGSNVLEKSSNFNHRSSKASDKSVKSIQWIGFDGSMIDDQEENRNALHVRNLPSKQQNSPDEETEEYTINGDYINTSEMNNRDIFGIIKTHDYHNIPRQENISKEYAPFNESTSRESGIIDKFTHELSSSSNESSDSTSNEDDKSSSMKKSKRSSKRISRVSFALKDEKIEFDENESSSTVSLARMSGRSSSSRSSTSSSATPSIIEEEDDDIEDEPEPPEDYTILNINNTTNSILNKPLHLYEDDGTSLSRFSF